MAATSPAPQISASEFQLNPALPHDVGEAEVWVYPLIPAEGDHASSTSPLLGPGAAEAEDLLGVDLLAAAAEAATGLVGDVVRVAVGGELVSVVLLVGVGDQSTTALRRAGATMARAAVGASTVATTIGAITDSEGLSAFVVGAYLGGFGASWRSTGATVRPPARIVLCGRGHDDDDDKVARNGVHKDEVAVLHRAIALGRAGWRSRFLASVPSNIKNPAWLAEQAAEIGEAAGLRVAVWDERKLADEGFGGVLAVGGASASPPRLIRMDYEPARATRRTPTVVLVGKGITFDTGGLNIKPPDGMRTMKRDMSGGATVIATMAALADVGCPLRVVGLVPAAENSIGGSAMRPGDVITHYGGRTSEVGNTDAEGRLVMADAMAYAVSEIGPAVLVDAATLTGAMKVALGQWLGGFFTNNEALAAAFRSASRASGEPIWRMPLAEVYESRFASPVADADNAGGRGPDSIVAALFLQHFTGGLPWVHLDYASTAEAPEDRFEWSQGPTGFGPRLLLEWLGSADPLAGVR